VKDLAEADGLTAHFVLGSYTYQQISDLQSKLEMEREARIAAQFEKRLTGKERTELNVLRAREHERQAKKLRRKRSAASRPKKGKKNKRKKK
jgi:hypothetical protein